MSVYRSRAAQHRLMQLRAVTDCPTNPDRPARLTRLGKILGEVVAYWLILAALLLATLGVISLARLIWQAGS